MRHRFPFSTFDSLKMRRDGGGAEEEGGRGTVTELGMRREKRKRKSGE